MSTHLDDKVANALKDASRQSRDQLLAAATQLPVVQRTVQQLQQNKVVACPRRPGGLSLAAAVAGAAVCPTLGAVAGILPVIFGRFLAANWGRIRGRRRCAWHQWRGLGGDE